MIDRPAVGRHGDLRNATIVLARRMAVGRSQIHEYADTCGLPCGQLRPQTADAQRRPRQQMSAEAPVGRAKVAIKEHGIACTTGVSKAQVE